MKDPLPEYKINGFEVDVWLEPCCVWEIKGADMQISPVYTAGIGDIDPKKVTSKKIKLNLINNRGLV